MKTRSIVPLSILFVLPTTLMVLASCMKAPKCPYSQSSKVASVAEVDSIKRYLAENSITNAVQDSSGVFYVTSNSGQGVTPDVCSSIYINYSVFRFGYLTPFDSNTTPTGFACTLGQLIDGVKKISTKIKAGSSVTMFIPPSLAYGATEMRDGNGMVILPANSYLKFQMSLLSVQ
jgi:FKBP-type peptidyl-prolyl cis-trans isomerase FkpA